MHATNADGINRSSSVIVAVTLQEQRMTLRISIKSTAWTVAWIAFVMALFGFTRSEAIPGVGFCIGTASELLFFANFLFAIFAISCAIGSHPNRFWLAVSIVASILVTMQLTRSFPMNTIHEQSTKLVLAFTPVALHGSAGWRASYAAEFANLFVYCWTPFVSLACGALARTRSDSGEA